MITLGGRDRAPATLSRIYICRRAGLTAREEASTETARDRATRYRKPGRRLGPRPGGRGCGRRWDAVKPGCGEAGRASAALRRTACPLAPDERPSVRKRDADHARPGVVVLVSVLHGWAAVTLCHHTSSHRFGLHEECQSMTPLSTLHPLGQPRVCHALAAIFHVILP
jgi:hypothetical protein